MDLVALAAQHQALVDSAKANPSDTALVRRSGINSPFARYFRVPTTWPACEKAPRTTNPRLK